MDIERLAELVDGPLYHSNVERQAVLLACALAYVVLHTGSKGEKALEEWCRRLQRDPDLDKGVI